jgi:transcription elongation factor
MVCIQWKEIMEIRGIDSVARHNQVFRFEGQTFKEGLLELDTVLQDLEQKLAEPSADELYEYVWIAGHGHEDVTESIAQALSLVAAASIKVGDRVRVLSGEGEGAVGFVEEVGDGQVKLYISNAESGGFILIAKPNTCVVKHFVARDFVKARSGSETGTSRWVLHCSDGIAIVYAVSRNEEASVQTERMSMFTSQPTHRSLYPLGTWIFTKRTYRWPLRPIHKTKKNTTT